MDDVKGFINPINESMDFKVIDVLWNHYNNQINENRAVHKSLEELRDRMHKLENEIKSRRSRTHGDC